MPNESSEQGGFLPFLNRLPLPKAVEPSSPLAQMGAALRPWLGGGLGLDAAPASDSGRAPGPQGGGPASGRKASSVDWLFGHLSDGVNAAGFGDLRVAEAKREEEERAKTEAAERAKKAQEEKDEQKKKDREAERKAMPDQIKEELDKKYEEDRKLFKQKKLDKEPTKPDLSNNETERRVHGKMIDLEYAPPSMRAAKDPDKPVGNLDTKEDRLKFLQGFTQNDPKDPKSEHYCGPTALMAAAMVDKGQQGLTPMVAQMQAEAVAKAAADPNNKDSAEQVKRFQQLQDKINKNELTNSDMQFMQKNLYDQLQSIQAKQVDKDGKPIAHDDGINQKTMETYLSSNKGMRDAMLNNNTHLALIDSDGDGKRNHWVLDLQGEKAVYDPYARKDGQVVTAADQVDDYRKTNAVPLHSDGSPAIEQVPEVSKP